MLPQLMAAQGWVVFEPNYRGSDNLGNKYESAIFGDAGEGPARDIMTGLEELEKRGFVDRANIAVTGWSYGGTMTTWLLGHYGGWKAAIAGAPLTDWLDEYNLSDFNVRMIDGFSPPAVGSPYVGNTMKAYIEQSPITYANKISTPTLIFSDTGDDLVPITQSYRLYHVLKDHGVPTRFIAYPIPGHSPAADPVRQRDLFRGAGSLGCLNTLTRVGPVRRGRFLSATSPAFLKQNALILLSWLWILRGKTSHSQRPYAEAGTNLDMSSS